MLADLLYRIDASPEDLAAWSQLRLQGRFTLRGMAAMTRCPLCSQCDASLDHLVRECEKAKPYLEPMLSAKWGAPLEVDDFSSMQTIEEMEVVVSVSGDLLRATLDAVRRPSKDPLMSDCASHLVPASAVIGGWERYS